mmetsp:Transcript_583/g.2066  ORF Transcript_583/g.2066 Transcript_583/m.2066 type:complete len:114 (-) Transcript_583:77-418(-)
MGSYSSGISSSMIARFIPSCVAAFTDSAACSIELNKLSGRTSSSLGVVATSVPSAALQQMMVLRGVYAVLNLPPGPRSEPGVSVRSQRAQRRWQERGCEERSLCTWLAAEQPL